MGSAIFPGNNGSSSATVTCDFFVRDTAADAYSAFPVAGLVISMPSGRDDALTLNAIRDIVVGHLLNGDVLAYWSPKIGSVEENLRRCLDGNFLIRISNASTKVMLYFERDVGEVSAAAV